MDVQTKDASVYQENMKRFFTHIRKLSGKGKPDLISCPEKLFKKVGKGEFSSWLNRNKSD